MQLSWGHQLFQLCGALLILIAYVGHQLKVMNAAKPLYSILNGAGSAILGVYAFWPRFQAGFVVLETAWVGISIYALARALRSEQRQTSEPED